MDRDAEPHRHLRPPGARRAGGEARGEVPGRAARAARSSRLRPRETRAAAGSARRAPRRRRGGPRPATSARRAPGISAARWRAIAWKSRLVVLADHDERRDAQLRRAAAAPATAPRLGVAVCSSSARRCCGRTSSRNAGATQKSTLTSVARSRLARLDRGLLLLPVRRHLLAEAPAREARADERELLDPVLDARARSAARPRRRTSSRRAALAGAPRRGRRTRTPRAASARCRSPAGRGATTSKRSSSTGICRRQSRESPSAECSSTTRFTASPRRARPPSGRAPTA